jgi:ribosomal protein S18 acetylase RimI-like enzyme
MPSDTPEFSPRILHPGDAPALMQLRHQAIRECAHLFGTPPEIELNRTLSYYRRKLVTYRLHGHTRIIGLWQNDSLKGMVGIRSRHQRDLHFGLIFSMYLTPELRGQGMGRKLLDLAQEQLTALWNPKVFRMNVEVNNTSALSLYQSSGFHIIETEPAAFRIHKTAYDVHLLEKTTAMT